MKIAPIRTERTYQASLKRVADLVPKTDQDLLDELEVLQALIERWERARFELPPPTALEAIRFRMEQRGLKPRDLEPFIGSRARVSEILSGKRPLSIDMIRALHQHLGIPAASLIQSTPVKLSAKPAAPSDAALKKLMGSGVMKARESFSTFLDRAFGAGLSEALLRKTRTERTNAKTDQAALTAWCAAVMIRANAVDLDKPKSKERGKKVARRLAKLSIHPDGPILAKRELARIGIILIVMEHLPGTYLDGAAMCRHDNIPVIALTLRHDRIDNFWFTLLHEYCHVSEHLKKGRTLIIDDLELKSSDEIEDEADRFAQEALIPQAIWDAEASTNMGTEDVVELAELAEVHPAIVAGRWQRENKDYRRFSRMLGRGEVRCLFASKSDDN